MKKIAIIGSGISGLSAAYLLKNTHDIHLFESEPTLGGHTNTLTVNDNGVDRNIDTGFIVFNDWNYPNFVKLLDKINIGSLKTEMSFSVHNPEKQFEYNGNTLTTLFSQKKNIISFTFWKFLYDIIRFNKLAKAAYRDQDNTNHCEKNDTLQSFLDKHKFNPFFRQNYILPMGAAIWSISLKEMQQFPLTFFVRFFYHHGLLNITNRPQWYVLKNGSESYIPFLIEGINNIQLATPVTGITRTNGKVQVSYRAKNNNEANDEIVTTEFDEVIIACHSDQALALLQDASDSEKQVLSKMRYQNNEVVLHQDPSLMPIEKASWASWNYRLTDDNDAPACVTYYMNTLQNLDDSASDYFVTLNQTRSIDKSKIIKAINFSHPVFDTESMQGQKSRLDICGKQHTHFAGAYWYNGFHEDGLKSALDVCKRFNATLET